MTTATSTTTATAESTRTVQVHRIYIRATAQAVWDAITSPDWNGKYGYGCASEFDLRPGGAYRSLSSDEMRAHGAPEQIIEGEVVEAEAPHRLVQTYRMLFTPELAAEPYTRLTYEIEEEPYGGVVKLTVTHDVTGAPAHAAQVAGEIKETGGGWAMLLSDLKSLLETGKTMAG
ncbi:SRPBCC family protein [Streptomyces sp. NPDC056244]|uniref:SRPBCC family protein n=1 Tax=unclassified Streptomyces TaxID=2593676 RepID=UPI0035DB5F36